MNRIKLQILYRCVLMYISEYIAPLIVFICTYVDLCYLYERNTRNLVVINDKKICCQTQFQQLYYFRRVLSLSTDIGYETINLIKLFNIMKTNSLCIMKTKPIIFTKKGYQIIQTDENGEYIDEFDTGDVPCDLLWE